MDPPERACAPTRSSKPHSQGAASCWSRRPTHMSHFLKITAVMCSSLLVSAWGLYTSTASASRCIIFPGKDGARGLLAPSRSTSSVVGEAS